MIPISPIIIVKQRSVIAVEIISIKTKTPKAANFVAYNTVLNAVKSRDPIPSSKRKQKVKIKVKMKMKRATFVWFVIGNSSLMICCRIKICR